MIRYLLVLLFLGCSLCAKGSWYGEKVKDGSDIVMVDVLYPYWPESTYFACWNINMYPHGGYFYAGVAMSPSPEEAESDTFRPGTVWSFWPADVYEGRQVRNTYMGPQVYAQQYVGEGASGNAGGRKIPWLKKKQWYTMCIRTWGADEAAKESFVGWWIKDKTLGEWHHIATFRVPYAATGFKGNGGFLEDFGHAGRNHRELWHGAGYMRHGGNWEKLNTVTVNVPKDNGMTYSGWDVNLRENDSYLVLSYTENRKYERNLEPGSEHSFEIKQPDTPSLDSLKATGGAEAVGSGLIVNWELDRFSSPQLGYTIEVYDNKELQGSPVVRVAEDIPQVRTKSIALPKAGPCWVKLVLTDIFGQSKELVCPVSKGKEDIRPASSVAFDSGLNYRYTEETGECKTLADLDFASSRQSGIARGVDIALRGSREEKFGFEYKGYLYVPQTGAYTFVLKSCDGSRLVLDGQIVMENDGIHSAVERRKSVFLQKGFVPFEMSYFRNGGGSQYTSLWLGWEYGGNPLKQIDQKYLVREKDSSVPSVKLKVAQAPKGMLNLLLETNASRIDKVEYYNGTRHIATLDKAPYRTGIIPFEGENSLWARVYYGNNRTVDTLHLNVPGKSVTAEGWDYMNRSEPGLSFAHGYNKADGTFSFTGEGEYLVNKQIKGDFDLVARVKGISPRNMDVCPDDWVGIMVASERNSKNYDREVAIFRTVNRGMRASADFSDLGTGRMSSFNLDETHTWLKISRRGNRFICYSSADGKKWVPGLERIVPMKDEVFAGITFRTIPGKGRGVFHASAQLVSLTPVKTVNEKPVFPVPSGRVIGYSVLRPDLLAVRYKAGVSLLTKRGESWEEANLKLPKGVKWVRSMAFDGKNLYLAAVSSASSESDLYVSDDMGKSWKNSAPGFRINPDPAYAVAGEIVAVNPKDNKEVFAGSHQGGIYVSRDGGETWSHDQLAGEAISCVVFHPIVQDKVCALTADPATGKSKVFYTWNGGKGWGLKTEVASTAFLRMVYDTRHSDMFYVLATDGLYGSFNECNSMNKCLHGIEYNTPYLAMDARKMDLNYSFVAPFKGDGIYNSSREWKNWEKRSGPGEWGEIFGFKIAEDDFEHVTMYARDGVYVSTDGGRSWKQVHKIRSK